MKKIIAICATVLLANTGIAQQFQFSTGYLFSVQTYTSSNLTRPTNVNLQGAQFTFSHRISERFKAPLFLDISVGSAESRIKTTVVDESLDLQFFTFPIQLEEATRYRNSYISVGVHSRGAVGKKSFTTLGAFIGVDQNQIEAVSIGQYMLTHYGVHGEEVKHHQNRLFIGGSLGFEYAFSEKFSFLISGSSIIQPYEFNRISQFKNNTGTDLSVKAVLRNQLLAGLIYSF